MRPGNDFEADFAFAAKTDCNGAREERLYSFLKGACPGPQLIMGDTERYYFTPIKQHDITWNFEKFLISPEGKPLKRYNPATSPYAVQADIEEQLEILREKQERERSEQEQEEGGVRKAKILQGMTKQRRKNRT